ncbi:MAG: hypothetical protein J7M30_02900, partial [Deltaproteobacteria bacterium]|nr:hypothetical protein [Deltaproteobacteria bacterium]
RIAKKYHRKSKRLSNKRTYRRKFLRFSLGTANLMPTVICGYRLRPLKNAQFWSSSRKAKISTAGIH